MLCLIQSPEQPPRQALFLPSNLGDTLRLGEVSLFSYPQCSQAARFKCRFSDANLGTWEGAEFSNIAILALSPLRGEKRLKKCDISVTTSDFIYFFCFLNLPCSYYKTTTALVQDSGQFFFSTKMFYTYQAYSNSAVQCGGYQPTGSQPGVILPLREGIWQHPGGGYSWPVARGQDCC